MSVATNKERHVCERRREGEPAGVTYLINPAVKPQDDNNEEEEMKAKIHPKYQKCTIMCACGAVIHTRSTKQSIRVDICSGCHPLFTGKQKFIDSAGRVDKYMKKYGKKS